MSEKQLVPSNAQRSRASNTYHVAERKSPTVGVQDVIKNDSSEDNLVFVADDWEASPIWRFEHQNMYVEFSSK